MMLACNSERESRTQLDGLPNERPAGAGKKLRPLRHLLERADCVSRGGGG